MLVEVANDHRCVIAFLVLLLAYIADLLRNKRAACTWFLQAILTYNLGDIIVLQVSPHSIRSYREETISGFELLSYYLRLT